MSDYLFFGIQKPRTVCSSTCLICEMNSFFSLSVTQIYLAHNNDRKTSVLPDNMEQVVGISHIAGDEIVLLDGQIVRADVLMLATGYR